jgi:hypothetical protein
MIFAQIFIPIRLDMITWSRQIVPETQVEILPMPIKLDIGRDSDMTKSEKENLPDVSISIRRLTKDKFPYVPLLTSLTDYKSQGQTFFEPC